MNAPIDLSGVRLETKRLVLRPFCEADLEDFYRYASAPGVGECAGWPHHQNIETSQKILSLFIAEKKTFALVKKEDGHVIGSLGIECTAMPLPEKYDHLLGRELGYVLSKDEWGQGYMSEAVAAVIHYCFDTLELDFLTCGHFVWNLRSEKVMVKAGFLPLGERDYETRMGTHETERFYLLENPAKKAKNP